MTVSVPASPLEFTRTDPATLSCMFSCCRSAEINFLSIWEDIHVLFISWTTNPDRMGESLNLLNVLKKNIKESHKNVKTQRARIPFQRRCIKWNTFLQLFCLPLGKSGRFFVSRCFLSVERCFSYKMQITCTMYFSQNVVKFNHH